MLHRNAFKISLIFLLFATAGCAGLGTSSLTGSNDSTVTSSELSDAETSLYESGEPFTLPVTIAKLDSVDVDKVTVEYGINSTGSSNLIRAATSDETGYNVIGTADAANTEQADFIMLANSTTSVIEPLNADGSFEIFIAADEGETYAIVPLDETQQTGGIPVYVVYANGVTTFMLTNSDVINSGQNLVNYNGSVYFSASNADGEYSIYAKPIDGTSISTIATGIESQIRYLAVDANGNLAVATQDGAVNYITNTGTSTRVNSPLSQNLLYQTTIFDEIYNFGTTLGIQDSFIPVAIKLFFDSSGNLYITNKDYINDQLPLVVQENMITKYNPDDDTLTGLVPSTVSLDRYDAISQGDPNSLFILLRETEQPEFFKLYQLDLTEDDIWSTKLLNFTHNITEELFINISSSESNIHLLASVVETLDNTILKNIYTQRGTLTPTIVASYEFNEDDHSEWFYIAPESNEEASSFITCMPDPDNTAVTNLMIHRVGYENPNQYLRLLDSNIGNSCSGQYTIDLEGRILFYNASLGDFPQLSLIKIDDLDPDQMELVDFSP